MNTRKWKPAETVYTGRNTRGRSTVTVNSRALLPGPSQALCNHSKEFNWGYGGSGPAQLALAILLDFTQDKDLAVQHYQQFKWAFVARWQDARFELTGKQIIDWLPQPVVSQ